MTVLTDKTEVGRTDTALLAKELVEITLLLLLRDGRSQKKVSGLYLIDYVFYKVP